MGHCGAGANHNWDILEIHIWGYLYQYIREREAWFISSFTIKIVHLDNLLSLFLSFYQTKYLTIKSRFSVLYNQYGQVLSGQY